MEIMVAFSLIASEKENGSEKEDGAEEEKSEFSESSWDKLKRGGIIGAAALTGGTVMAITGGMGTDDFNILDTTFATEVSDSRLYYNSTIKIRLHYLFAPIFHQYWLKFTEGAHFIKVQPSILHHFTNFLYILMAGFGEVAMCQFN